MAKYFKNPFGINGDLTDIPDDTQLDGSVSYNTGWSDVYQRDPVTDPTAKRLSRAKHNKLFNDITANIKEWQQQTFPDWISDAGSGTPYEYSKDAIVTYTDARAYVSLVDNNTGEPTVDTANWKLFEDFGGINIHSLTAKTTLVDNDELALADSASSFSLKKLTFANLKTVLKSFFVDLTSTQTITGTKTFSGTVTAPTFSGALNGNAATATYATSANTINGWAPVQQGGGIGQGATSKIYIGWSTGNRLKATVDFTDIGNFVMENGNVALPRAYVCCNGTTGAIYAGQNVASVTDNGVGDFTVNFIVGLPTEHYAVCGSASGIITQSRNATIAASSSAAAPYLKSTTQCRLFFGSNGTNDAGIFTAAFIC